MAPATLSIAERCVRARRAARALAALDGVTRDDALRAIAAALAESCDEILQANRLDLEAGADAGLSDALMDRLALDESRVLSMARGMQQIAALPDPVGEVIDGGRLANGLALRRVRAPLGVVAVVYEARPNVTVDAAALCLKSANAALLRPSRSVAHSAAALAEVVRRVGAEAGLPADAVTLVADGGREGLAELATQEGTVDLIIPRGGEGLKAALRGVASVPVIYAASGNNHVYVHASADLPMARAIALNAKLQRPGVCNAAETLLVDAAVAPAFLPELLAELDDAGVVLHGDARVRAHAGPDTDIAPASDADWDTEYLAPELAVGVVDGLSEAIEHIAAHGSGHSEAIVTRDVGAAHRFQREVDAACVYVNASTRFTDGGEFGMGAEIGISTQKLHARGPIGPRELCTVKYLIEGDGQIRT